MPATATVPKKTGFTFKLVRWTILAILVLVVLVMLKKPVPPANFSHPSGQAAVESAASFDTKLNDLEKARASGQPTEIHLTNDELNSAFQRSAGKLPHPAQANGTTSAAPLSQPEGPPQVKSFDFAMVGNEVVGQFVVDRYGVDIYVTLRGQLTTKDGYVGLKPSLFKVGDLTVPNAWVEDVLRTKLAEPENREKLKLPPFISDVYVENGELVITEK